MTHPLFYGNKTSDTRQLRMRMALPCMNSTAGTPRSLHPALLLTNSKTSNTIKVCSESATLVQLSLVFFALLLQCLRGAIHRPENQSPWDENVAQRRRRGRMDFLRGQTSPWISNFLYRNPQRGAMGTPHKAPSPTPSEPVFIVQSVAVLNLYPYRSHSCFQRSRMNPLGETGTAAGTKLSKYKVLHSWKLEIEYKPQHTSKAGPSPRSRPQLSRTETLGLGA